MEEKSLYIGNSGNKATVTEESRATDTVEAKHLKSLVARAGKQLCPLGADYLGSATVHYYAKEGLEGPIYFVGCQADVKKVAEGHADLGWKQLKSVGHNAVYWQQGDRRGWEKRG